MRSVHPAWLTYALPIAVTILWLPIVAAINVRQLWREWRQYQAWERQAQQAQQPYPHPEHPQQ